MHLSKLYKNWAVHNIIGHPLMQIFLWLRMQRMAKKVHDSTLPPDIIP